MTAPEPSAAVDALVEAVEAGVKNPSVEALLRAAGAYERVREAFDTMRLRAELAESRLSALNAKVYAAAAAERAKRGAFGPAPTERDRRGVPVDRLEGVDG